MGSNFSKAKIRTQEHWMKDPPRCPHLLTPDALRRMGFSETMIKALHPNSTPIGYHSAQENKRASLPQNPYNDNTYVVRGPVNPHGAGGFARAHADKAYPQGSYHYSAEEMRKRVGMQFAAATGGNVNVQIHKALALTEDKRYVSDASLRPGSYQVEISWTTSGLQQLRVNKQYVDYSYTRPIKNIFK